MFFVCNLRLWGYFLYLSFTILQCFGCWSPFNYLCLKFSRKVLLLLFTDSFARVFEFFLFFTQFFSCYTIRLSFSLNLLNWGIVTRYSFWLLYHPVYFEYHTKCFPKVSEALFSLAVELRIRELYPLQTLNYIWSWGSSFGDLGSVKYPFIDITPRSTLLPTTSTC